MMETRYYFIVVVLLIIERVSNSQKLLLHKALEVPHIIPYPSDVSCDIASQLPDWTQLSFYYPISNMFDRLCILCQVIERKTECYSNFWGQTSEHTISEDQKSSGHSHLRILNHHINEHGLGKLQSAAVDHTFEIVPNPYIGCSWLRTLESTGEIIRCRVTSCKYGIDGLMSPIRSPNALINTTMGRLSDEFGTMIYSPFDEKNNTSNCPFSLKGVDYCSGGSPVKSSVETFVCTGSQALFQIDHASNVFICNVEGNALFLTRSGEYVSRKVISLTNGFFQHQVQVDNQTRLDIRKSISSLSELNFVNNIIREEKNSKFFFERCLEYKYRWSQWVYGYPESCLAALSLISTTTYAACTYSTEGIIAYETVPIFAYLKDLIYDRTSDKVFYHNGSISLYVLPLLGIITNKATNSSPHQYMIPHLYPLANGNFWSLITKEEVSSYHYSPDLKILTLKPFFKDKDHFPNLLTVPFSHHLYPDRWVNHTKDYKHEFLPLIIPAFGFVFNSALWAIGSILLLFAFIKLVAVLIPGFRSKDSFNNLRY
ncbi:MAG: hypothetical protein [Xiangshan rhabdo-like virus 4]|uniref:Uncharacterized protein n=1 Tax=Xiangshan rhabdo-like virus 4 TaxID=2886227 RepID=A0A8K1YQQ2_9RHAB|nr:MAG: hypothetical protein [Xiangshan rhabdo-like virus 4]